MKKSALAGMIGLAGTALVGCGSDGRPTQHADPATANPKGAISSSIREGAELTGPVRWQARLEGLNAADVSQVRFLIDGKVAHVEQLAPFEFAGSHNRLIPGTLAPGSHTFAVHAQLVDGGRLTAATSAKVARGAQPIPAALVGRWTRTVSPAEVRRTARFRNPEYGEPLPVGRWTVEIGADGVARYIDPYKRPDSLTIGQLRSGSGGRLIVGDEIPNAGGAGYFCPDTVGTGTYRWSRQRDQLVVAAIDDRACADRNSFWNGTFTRMEER